MLQSASVSPFQKELATLAAMTDDDTLRGLLPILEW
jgi:hypothetical protein